MYTHVLTYTNPLEAHIVRGRMEAEGISAIVLFENHIWAKWSLSQALGGVRLLVPSNMIDSATEIADSINSGEYQEILLKDQGESKLKCPKCGSTYNEVHVWLWKLSLAVLFRVSLAFPYTSHLYSCDACKHSWIAHKQRPYPLWILIIYQIALPVIFGAIHITFAHLFNPHKH